MGGGEGGCCLTRDHECIINVVSVWRERWTFLHDYQTWEGKWKPRRYYFERPLRLFVLSQGSQSFLDNCKTLSCKYDSCCMTRVLPRDADNPSHTRKKRDPRATRGHLAQSFSWHSRELSLGIRFPFLPSYCSLDAKEEIIWQRKMIKWPRLVPVGV